MSKEARELERGAPAAVGMVVVSEGSESSGPGERWARDISIITADEAYLRAFCIIRSVFQCVLESSGTVT